MDEEEGLLIQDNTEDDDDVFVSMNSIQQEHEHQLPVELPVAGMEANAIYENLAMFLLLLQSKYKLTKSAVKSLLEFLPRVLQLGQQLSTAHIQQIVKAFPKTVNTLRKQLGVDSKLQHYVTCPKCYTLYNFEECVNRNHKGEIVHVNTCTSKIFQKQCNSQLLHELKWGKRTVHYPQKSFVCKSILATLAEMIKRPGFLADCEHWRSRSVPDGIYADIYDGQVWKDFQEHNGRPFLSANNNFALMLNVDWFQPFDRSTYSVGVIYAVILNLPRDKRFKVKNILICGIIPGPHEPKGTINTFLQPLVKELEQLWKGTYVPDPLGILNQRWIRAAVILTCCDIPATRKVLGFLSHNAIKGCSKCLFTFKQAHDKNGDDDFQQADDKVQQSDDEVEQVDSEAEWADDDIQQSKDEVEMAEESFQNPVDETTWLKRDPSKHKQLAWQHSQCSVAAKQKKLEKAYGVRYSILNELPYFDCVRLHAIDPMHNLLLGTPKRMITLWKRKGVISDKDLQAMQERVDRFSLPHVIGRIPRKIASKFANFTAEEWRNWTNIFSLSVLKDFVPHPHYMCWTSFVQACHLLCTRTITLAEVEEAHSHLRAFLQQCVDLYGHGELTPNMHLHLHMKECLLDYGPTYSFWLFSCERYNGTLGSFKTNNRNIETQIIERFLADQRLTWKEEKTAIEDIHENLRPAFDYLQKEEEKGMQYSTTDMTSRASRLLELYNGQTPAECLVHAHKLFQVARKAQPTCKEPEKSSNIFLTNTRKKELETILKTTHGDEYLAGSLHTLALKFSCLTIEGELFGGRKASKIFAYRPSFEQVGAVMQVNNCTLGPCEILQLLKIHFKVKISRDVVHKWMYFTEVKWFQVHCQHQNHFPLPCYVYGTDETSQNASLIPVDMIACHFAATTQDIHLAVGKEEVSIAVPLNCASIGMPTPGCFLKHI